MGDVRFGSKADICNASTHVRFTPDSDRESGFPRKVMSALPPKADIGGDGWNVRFVPILLRKSASAGSRRLPRFREAPPVIRSLERRH